ncbi:hypothetical protein EYF80_016537 [Liparis tanakae]|uniref:Uncharacterized protein n=1 Tax=Liparis tanakae TaxID=230148 RepID=A0A4Z2I576_9TELE|nr:hypothetical protein EYF80_016537 [Liparis tanakae]
MPWDRKFCSQDRKTGGFSRDSCSKHDCCAEQPGTTGQRQTPRKQTVALSYEVHRSWLTAIMCTFSFQKLALRWPRLLSIHGVHLGFRQQTLPAGRVCFHEHPHWSLIFPSILWETKMTEALLVWLWLR